MLGQGASLVAATARSGTRTEPLSLFGFGDGQRIVAVVPDDASDQYSRRHITLWVNALTELRRPTSSQH